MLNDELLSTNINYHNIKRYFVYNDTSCIINNNKPTSYLCSYAYHKVL